MDQDILDYRQVSYRESYVRSEPLASFLFDEVQPGAVVSVRQVRVHRSLYAYYVLHEV